MRCRVRVRQGRRLWGATGRTKRASRAREGGGGGACTDDRLQLQKRPERTTDVKQTRHIQAALW